LPSNQSIPFLFNATVPFSTSYAKLDIPLKPIETALMHGNRETASLELQTGDRLIGSFDFPSIELQTLFGKVLIEVRHIKSIERVFVSSAPAAEDVR
jgi:hypothetical protein